MKTFTEEVTKLHAKAMHHKNNCMTYAENISSIETYNKDQQNTIEDFRNKVAENVKQIEVAKETLSKEKDGSNTVVSKDKKGVVVNKRMLCHLCKGSYVSMVTKPCNHCIMCWNCYQGFVQSKLHNCLVCNQRIEFVFKIKYK